MANRLRQLDEATRAVPRWLMEAGGELREARLRAGLRQLDVARALGWSQTKVLRIEHGRLLAASHRDLARFAAVIGLRLHAQFYPRGVPLRDTAQLALLRRLRARTSPTWRWQLEWVLPGSRDLRAFDALLTLGEVRVAIEAITRLRDVQAQVRAAQVKARDAGIARLILLIADTHANRRAAAEYLDLLASAFPLGPRPALRALASGRDPERRAIVFL